MMNLYNDPAQPKTAKQGLVDALTGGKNTGISGGPAVLGAPPMAPSEPAPAPTSAPVPASPAAVNSPFQSQNATTRGYLDEAMRAFAPTVQGIKDEAGRKSAVESYVQSLMPEIQKRGGNVTDIKGEKARVDGRLIDFYRDIEGAADPQYLDVTDERPAGPAGGGLRPSFAGSSISGMLQGDAQAGIQQALAQLGAGQDDSMLQQLIAQLGGGQV